MKRLIPVLVAFAMSAAPALAQQAQPPQPPAPETMSRQQLRDEVTTLRAIVGGGAVRPTRPAGCSAAEHRQFDFWVGEWDVSPSASTTGVVVAESTITMHDQGCVMIEHWRPFRGAHGHSINTYDATDQRWHQAWADATGLRTAYRGQFSDGVMAFDMQNPPPGQNGVVTQQRMNFRAIDANTVRQWGEAFDPAANTWNVTWDLTYRRRAGTR